MVFRTLAVVAAALAVVLAIGVPTSAALAEDRALIIGIDAYETGVNPLKGPVRDARMMAEMAQKVWGFAPNQIRLLLDRDASAKNILASFKQWLIDGTKPGDRVFLYFSGHGAQFDAPDTAEDPNLQWQALVGYNPPGEKGIQLFVLDKHIRDLMKALPDREVVAVFDNCHSGTVTRGARKFSANAKIFEPDETWIPPRTKERPTTRGLSRDQPGIVHGHPNVISFTAVTTSQLSLIEGNLGYSVFTKRIFDGLMARKADRSGSGKVTVTQLFDYVRDETDAYCRANDAACREDGAAFGMTPELETPDKWRGLDLLAWRPKGGTSAGAAPAQPNNTEPSEVIGSGNVPPPQVAISGGPVIRVGETIRVGVQSKFKGYVIVLDISDNGQVAQLFPSKVCTKPTREVRVDAPLIMPDPTYGCVFRASDPGKGRIVAIVTEDNVPIEDLLNQSKASVAVKDGAAYLAKLSAALNSTWRKDVSNRAVRWSMSAVGYDISAK